MLVVELTPVAGTPATQRNPYSNSQRHGEVYELASRRVEYLPAMYDKNCAATFEVVGHASWRREDHRD